MKKGWKIVLLAAGTLLLVGVLRGCVAGSYLIPSSGMENVLYRGERIVVNKWSYGLRLPLMAWWGYHRWGDGPVGRGDVIVFNNPANLQEKVVDRREAFIGRCIGLPGDTLMVDSLFAADHSGPNTPDRKRLYAYPGRREQELTALLKRLSIRDDGILGSDSSRHVRSLSSYEHYLLTQAIQGPCWIKPLEDADSGGTGLRPLVVPGKEHPVRVTPLNRTLLRNTLVLHEGRRAEVKHDTLYVDGRPATVCRFTQDYYWVGSDNSLNLQDSRLFGFVPKSHVIGRASFVWMSKEEGSGWFSGYRWKRIGSAVK